MQARTGRKYAETKRLAGKSGRREGETSPEYWERKRAEGRLRIDGQPTLRETENKRVLIAKARAKGRFYNTKPERVVRAWLEELGLTFKWQQRVGKYTVDFIVADCVVIEVNGCYWHACRECGFKDPRRMRFKDQRRHRSIRSKGYALMVIWEHDLDSFGASGA